MASLLGGMTVGGHWARMCLAGWLGGREYIFNTVYKKNIEKVIAYLHCIVLNIIIRTSTEMNSTSILLYSSQ